MQNHYFDNRHPLHPYTHSLPATPGTVPPVNALRGDAPPTAPEGFHPAQSGGAWTVIEDHRHEAGYVKGEPYTIKDFGPYPEGWSETPPPPSLEEQYRAERAAVRQKYEAPWDGASGGILSSLQMLMTAVQLKVSPDPEEIAAIRRDYEAALTALYAEYDAIDQKYGVA